ncbi:MULTISPECIES: helix-turn-helix domain-containing protein [Veillonella]|nr:helix-turn-helix domain-containing protein [Veillonella sp. LMAG:2]
MTKYSKEIKEKVYYLFERGWGFHATAKELNIPEGTVRNWLFKYKNGYSTNRRIRKRNFSAEFKQTVIETRWANSLSFKETAELFNLDNPSLIAIWQKSYLDEGISGLQPKPKGRPPMQPKKQPKEQPKEQNNQSIKSDKERIKALEAENARLKYELSFYNDFMEEMRKIAKPNRSVKKNKQSQLKD